MLNGIPIQTFTRITEMSAMSGLVSHGVCPPRPRVSRKVFSTPVSWSRMRRQTTPDTTMGTSQGSRIRERRTPPRGKRRLKKTARARPTQNWPSREPAVKTRVCRRALPNRASWKTDDQLSAPLKGASPVKKVFGV